MNKAEKITENEVTATYHLLDLLDTATVRPAGREDEARVLAFLRERPWHSFGLLGYIYSNGLLHPANRGIYYLCLDDRQNLEGVCLIGYHTLFEARSDRAIEAFARLTRACRVTHLILGEAGLANRFWNYFTEGVDEAATIERHILLSLNQPPPMSHLIPGLRIATLADLDPIVRAHARLAIELTGKDCSSMDPARFRRRCAGRLARGHTWVWMRGGRVIFKIDIVTSTPELVYLDSLWIDPAERGKGYGSRCLTQLANCLLQNSACVCLLVEETNHSARALYEKVGFEPIGHYKAIFQA